MSPRAWISRRIFCTKATCAGSVVRTNQPTWRPSSAQVARKTALTRSVNSFGGTPSRAAACAILSPCSSVPVTKNASRPRWRQKHTSVSATIVVYALPRWGSSFT